MPPAPNANPAPQPEADDLVLESFHQRWRESEVDLLDFWRNHLTSRSFTLLTALVKADLSARFERGQRPSAADYLELFPDLCGDRERVVSLVYEEFCLLEDRHENPDVSEFCARYGPWSDSLRSQLAYHRELSQIIGQSRSRVRYPATGELFKSFELRKVLGEGGASQVYLAADKSLADRLVVLKLSHSPGNEPTIMGQLDHKNIVPIYNVVDDPASKLQGICMPYYPGATLATVLKALATANQPRRAAAILDLVGVERHGELEDDDPWKDFPAAGSFSEGVAWLGVRLANALSYLHSREVLHRDIKPQNILVTPRFGLRLFDFNLAHSPNSAISAEAASKGGTLPYMAPEQLRAFLDPKDWDQVGSAAEIYACGLLLREMVTGRPPHCPDKNLPLPRAINELLDHRRAPIIPCRNVQGDVPPSLDAIISTCLAYDPERRYASAEALSHDLRCFLKRLPPSVARGSSPAEAAEATVNWAFRRRKAIAGLIALGVLLLGGLLLLRALRGGIRQLPEFKRGQELLHSSAPDDWKRAAELFRQLSDANPQTTWPLVYGKVAATQLRDSAMVKYLLEEAMKRGDAISVFDEYLESSPDDADVTLALARMFKTNRNLARQEHYLNRANLAVPNHPGVLADLADLYRQRNDFAAAIDLYERAIKAPAAELQADYIPQFRQNLISALIEEVDVRLDRASPSSPPPVGPRGDELGVVDLLVKLRSQVHAFATDWADDIKAHPLGGHGRTLTVCQASLALAAGFHAERGRQGAGLTELTQAGRLLREAEKAAREAQIPGDNGLSGEDHDFAQKVYNLRIKLNQRLKDCKIDPESLRSFGDLPANPPG